MTYISLGHSPRTIKFLIPVRLSAIFEHIWTWYREKLRSTHYGRSVHQGQIACNQGSQSILKENCWFFCSALQEHLAVGRRTTFTRGELHHANMATQVKLRLNTRLVIELDLPSVCHEAGHLWIFIKAVDVYMQLIPLLQSFTKPDRDAYKRVMVR